MKFPVLLIYLKNYFLINGMLNMKNLKRKISFNEKSFLELKKFRVDERNLFDITISLSGGNEIENIGCLVKEIQLAYDKICEIIYQIYPFSIALGDAFGTFDDCYEKKRVNRK